VNASVIGCNLAERLSQWVTDLHVAEIIAESQNDCVQFSIGVEPLGSQCLAGIIEDHANAAGLVCAVESVLEAFQDFATVRSREPWPPLPVEVARAFARVRVELEAGTLRAGFAVSDAWLTSIPQFVVPLDVLE
jgi:hypothetical protein